MKKSLKIIKGYSETVNRRMTEYSVQKIKDKRTNNDLQNATQKTRDCATRTPLKTVGEFSSYNIY